MTPTKRHTNPDVRPHGKPAPDTRAELKAPPVTFFLPLNIAFYLTLASHVTAALYAPIPDCDETFNYWEPLHYLTHGYGLQTWEYSPTYSIRSWTYLLQYAFPIKAISFLGKSKTFEFYFIRVLLAAVSAASETRLYSAICKTLNPRIGIFYLMVAAFTPGFFYASTALLPSSFAMYTSSLALAAFLNSSTENGIVWFAVGALLGWPFAGVLILPFVLDDVFSAIFSRNVALLVRRYTSGALRCLTVLIMQVTIDSLFYHKLLFVPWNIVHYNVFGGADRGPDIFGTEPWHFYLRNLILNFNVWILLAGSAGPLLLINAILVGKRVTKKSPLHLATFLTPFYLWLAIFTLQPHKEERFMFPAYPFLALNAATAIHFVLTWIGATADGASTSKVPPRIKLILIVAPMLVAINIGFLRTLGTVTAYRAPLQVFETLTTKVQPTETDSICIGKEWYRFSSSFFLPNGSHAKFVKSNFDGLLPGEFNKATDIKQTLAGTRAVPPNMNDRNEEDFTKYTNIEECIYLIDSVSPSFKPSANEPNYVDSEDWEKISCFPFLDAGSTHLLARTIWIPNLFIIPQKFRRNWGTFCLLKRKE